MAAATCHTVLLRAVAGCAWHGVMQRCSVRQRAGLRGAVPTMPKVATARTCVPFRPQAIRHPMLTSEDPWLTYLIMQVQPSGSQRSEAVHDIVWFQLYTAGAQARAHHTALHRAHQCPGQQPTTSLQGNPPVAHQRHPSCPTLTPGCVAPPHAGGICPVQLRARAQKPVTLQQISSLSLQQDAARRLHRQGTTKHAAAQDRAKHHSTDQRTVLETHGQDTSGPIRTTQVKHEAPACDAPASECRLKIRHSIWYSVHSVWLHVLRCTVSGAPTRQAAVSQVRCDFASAPLASADPWVTKPSYAPYKCTESPLQDGEVGGAPARHPVHATTSTPDQVPLYNGTAFVYTAQYTPQGYETSHSRRGHTIKPCSSAVQRSRHHFPTPADTVAVQDRPPAHPPGPLAPPPVIHALLLVHTGTDQHNFCTPP